MRKFSGGSGFWFGQLLCWTNVLHAYWAWLEQFLSYNFYPNAYELHFHVRIVTGFIFLLLNLIGSLPVISWYRFRVPKVLCLSCWSVCYFMTISLEIAKFSGLFQVFKVYVDWGPTTWHFCSPRSIKLITSNIKLVLDSLSWWDFGFVRKETNFLLIIWSVGWQFVILMGQNGFFSNFLEVRDGRALCLPYSQYCIKNKN